MGLLLIHGLTSPLVKLFVASLALEWPAVPPRTLSLVLPKDISERWVSIPAVTLFRRYSFLLLGDDRRSRAL